MHRPTQVARWYRRIDPRCFAGQAPAYAPEEVRDLLTSVAPGQPERAERVRAVAAVPQQWLGYLDDRQRRLLGVLADRLPSLVYLYSTGASPEEMRARFGGLTPWRYEAALEVASACIAQRLNAARA